MAKKAKGSTRPLKQTNSGTRTPVPTIGGQLIRLLGIDQIEATNGSHPSVLLSSAAGVEENELTKADVLGLVLKGEWTPDRAEDWAKRVGLPPFAGKPDTAAYDPIKELNWTLCMALIWVASRDIDEVREAWPEWWEAQRTWREFELHGRRCWSLGPPRRPEDYSRYDGYRVDPRTAVKQLWGELQTGAIVATGVSKRKGLRRVIQREEWCDLRPCGSHPVISYFLDSACTGTNESWSRAFSKVLLPVKEALRIFPSRDGALDETAELVTSTPTANANPAVRKPSKPEEAAAALARLYPNGRPSLTKPELLIALKPEIGNISIRTLSRAIAKVWPSTAPKRAKT